MILSPSKWYSSYIIDFYANVLPSAKKIWNARFGIPLRSLGDFAFISMFTKRYLFNVLVTFKNEEKLQGAIPGE